MTSRISLAAERGMIDPNAARIMVFGATAETDLSTLPKAAVTVVQTFRPDFDALSVQGYSVVTEPPEAADLAIVVLPRSKEAARARIAAAADVTGGRVLVDGQKTDGVESVLKEVRRRADVPDVLSKEHGKCFVVSGGDFRDWRDRGTARRDGFVTRAGVFSEDGPDPGSVLLAAALPKTPGSVVVDLGAAWGYIAREVLARDGVSRVHLVEGEKLALDCARINVTDERANFHWADARNWGNPGEIDTVVCNPPFHRGRMGDPAIGAAFIGNASRILKRHGQLFLVANRHLPYEKHLEAAFREVAEIGGDRSYKLFRAARPRTGKG